MIDTMVIIPDQHAHPDHPNDRADWAGELIKDLKPDVVVNGGDAADMSSLSSYDKGKRSFMGKSYRKDIDAHLDFQERLWAPIKKTKKKMPRRIYFEGNHEERVERALDLSPELTGTIGFKDFQFDEYYDEVIRYRGGTPGMLAIENILFAHYFVSGVKGLAVGGEHSAHSLIAKNKMSSVAFHSHLYDYCTQTNSYGRTFNAVVAGCYQDYINDWSGNAGELWRPGITILRNVDDGDFDIQFIHINTLRKEYG